MDAREDLALTRSLTALPGWAWHARMGVRQGERSATVLEVYEGEWLDTAYIELRLSMSDGMTPLAHPDYVALDFDCGTTGGHLLNLLDGPVDAMRVGGRWCVRDESATAEAPTLARACAGLARERGYWRQA
jgi:hypothetical protein